MTSMAKEKPPRDPRPTGAEIDLNRAVWDPAYRRRVLERLKREETANDDTPPAEEDPDR